MEALNRFKDFLTNEEKKPFEIETKEQAIWAMTVSYTHLYPWRYFAWWMT